MNTNKRSHPSWIRTKAAWGDSVDIVKDTLISNGLNSVCVEAVCPNKGECWNKKHVTFMILGEVCTRGCLFCGVGGGETNKPDPEEPKKIARAVGRLGMKYVVITSVTRDDLPDKGTEQFIKVVSAIKKRCPDVTIELLIPDMSADPVLLKRIAYSGAHVIGHNIEMPRRLYDAIRPASDYDRSIKALDILNSLRNEGVAIKVKSSMILGLGEESEEVKTTIDELSAVGVDIVYLGQYLNPSGEHYPVEKYYSPEEYNGLKRYAENAGFSSVMSGPLVRSSYRAEEAYRAAFGSGSRQ